MKPLHVGLLVVGAALAGGIAVKMTQPPVLQTASVAKPAGTARQADARPAETRSVDAPPPPVLAPPEITAPSSVAPAGAAAPPPVYTEQKPSPVPVRKTKPAKDGPAKNGKVEIAKNVPPPYTSQPQPNATPPQQSAAEPNPAAVSPAPPDNPEPQPAPEQAAPPAPRRVTLSAGMTIPARIIESLSSDKVHPGDTFQATLAEPLVADGLVIAERGARVTGKVIDSSQAGKFQGVSKLELALISIYSSDGQKVAISTRAWKKQGESQRNSDVAKIGGGAALGAIIGAIAGGGKGAAIGAGVGGAAGTGAVMIPSTKPVTVPTETVIRFQLATPVTITERI